MVANPPRSAAISCRNVGTAVAEVGPASTSDAATGPDTVSACAQSLPGLLVAPVFIRVQPMPTRPPAPDGVLLRTKWPINHLPALGCAVAAAVGEVRMRPNVAE